MGFEIDGKGTYPSILGILLSLMVNFVLIGYFYKQFKVVQEYDDTSYQSQTLKNYFSVQDKFRYEDTKFKFAVVLFSVVQNAPTLGYDDYLNLVITE